jgi:hypothetical protein
MPDARSFALRRPPWRVWLAGALAVVVVVIVLIARLSGGDDDGGEPTGAPATSGSASADPGPVEPSAEPAPDGPAGVEAAEEGKQPVAADALTLARQFAEAWATPPPAQAPQQWFAGVSPYVDETLAAQLKELDPATLPAKRVTGAPKAVSGGVTNADVQVPTDAGDLLVVCVLVPKGWVVADFEFERRPS